MRLVSLETLTAQGIEAETLVPLNDAFLRATLNDEAICNFASKLEAKNAYLHAFGRTVLAVVGTPTRGVWLKHELQRHGAAAYYLKYNDCYVVTDITLTKKGDSVVGAPMASHPSLKFKSDHKDLLALFDHPEGWSAVIDPFASGPKESRVSRRQLVVVRRVDYFTDLDKTEALVFNVAELL